MPEPFLARTFRVVVNHEEQYSLWPAGERTPTGWRDAGKTGDAAACLRYIEEVWTDMKPPEIRRFVDEMWRQEKGR